MVRVRPRPGTVLLLAVLLLAAAPAPAPASAHGEHESDCDDPAGDDAWNHALPWSLELAPGETIERTLSFNGCPLEESWRVLLRTQVANGTVEATLLQSNDTVGTATLAGPDGLDTWTLPHTDFPVLRLHNPADADGTDGGNVTVRAAFDQTCLCPVKGIHFAPGVVWMNALADAGDRVTFDVTLVPSAYPWPGHELGNVTARAEVFGEPGTEETWSFHPDQDPHCRDSPRWTGCFQYTFTAPADGRQDVLLWLDHDGGDAWALATRPVIEVEPGDAEGAGSGVPGVGAFVGLLSLLGAAFVRRARRY